MKHLWREVRYFALLYVVAPICEFAGSTWHWAPMMRLRFEYEAEEVRKVE